MIHLEVDLHTHTVASRHAYSTVKEMAEAAAAKGIKVMGVTDHGLRMPGGPHEYHFANLAAVPRYLMGVEILRGVEANIIDANGRLDMPVSILRHLDLVLAGFHEGCGYESGTVEENTRAMVAALHNPFVHAIVHPGNPDYPVDLERVVLAAKACGKALEINNKSFTTSRPGSKPNCLRLARLAKKYQLMVVINSDAHVFSSVGVCDEALEVAREAGLEPDQILNTSAERSLAYLAYHRSTSPNITIFRERAG